MAKPGSPRVGVFTLGGTIAMRSADGGGAVPNLSASDLLAAVPGPGREDIELTVREITNKPGASLSLSELLGLASQIRTVLDQGCLGAVVIQGTDTIEETAYLLDLVISSECPIVVTGAMRNSSLAGADGPANILAAIQVAASDAARGLGALVVMNDQIHAARWAQKTHTGSPAAFTSPGFGPVGHVIEGRADVPVGLRQRAPRLNPDPASSPQVGLMTITLGDDGSLIEAVSDHIDGLVVAALGAGHVPDVIVPILARLAVRVPVVLASRTGAGSVHRQTYSFPGSEADLLARGLISAGYLPPVKARLLLHLLLAEGADDTRIRKIFTS